MRFKRPRLPRTQTPPPIRHAILTKSQKIFVVTPERALEVVSSNSQENIGLIIFDEAQISEEKVRGISFDTFVRRSDTLFPSSKKVFAHPFIENPEAQLEKHQFTEVAAAKCYEQGSVGKIFLQKHSNGSQYLFSPYSREGHLLKNCLKSESDLAKEALLSGESMLVFTNKSAITKGTYKDDFSEYLDLCERLDDVRATAIIDEVEELIGAKNRVSDLVIQMRKGIVIHHGSIPLSVRSLIENFTRLGFAKICFATSTLAQGVNMPFKVIWIHNLTFYGTKENQALGLKNLIGRAGRTSQEINQFDYGYVILKNPKVFISKFQGRSRLSEESVLDLDSSEIPEDWEELVTAMKDGTMNEDLNLPKEEVERLRSAEVVSSIEVILELLFDGDQIITSSDYSKMPVSKRTKLKEAFHSIYEHSLRRPIEKGEKAVLSAAITILLMKIQGRSFKEILAIRFNFITNQAERRSLLRKKNQGTITPSEHTQKLEEIPTKFSITPETLPNKDLKHSFNRFKGIKAKDLRYDTLVYDTYDYLDKVISFSLTDVFVAAFTLYHEQEGVTNAQRFSHYMKYGTANDNEILLLRYGFTLDEIDAVAPHVISIDENEIVFKESVVEIGLSRAQLLIERYQS